MSTPPTDPYLGRVIDDRYQIVERIAAGGMATVYRAHATRLGRDVAVKVMHPHLAMDAGFVQRFETEARAIAKLSHPNVVQIFDQGVDSGTIYIAMEFVGHSLRDAMAARGAYPIGEALHLTEQILAALAAAHQLGIVHRDIKPENILLTEAGQVKVADFGIARALGEVRATKTGEVIGTVGYMAPELLTSGQISPAIDIYAVGVILYELLTGRQPFAGQSSVQIALRQTTEEFPPLGIPVPAAISSFLGGLTAPVATRFHTGTLALQALQAARAGHQTFLPAATPAAQQAIQPVPQPGAPVAGLMTPAGRVVSARRNPLVMVLSAVPLVAAAVILLIFHPWSPGAPTGPMASDHPTAYPPVEQSSDADDPAAQPSEPEEPDTTDEPTVAQPADDDPELVGARSTDNEEGKYSWDGDTLQITDASVQIAITHEKKLPKVVDLTNAESNSLIDLVDYEFTQDTTITFSGAGGIPGIITVNVPPQLNITTKWTTSGAGQITFRNNLDGGQAVGAGDKSGTRKYVATKGGPVLTLNFDNITGIGIVQEG
jgi:serine/threonine protein kinase